MKEQIEKRLRKEWLWVGSLRVPGLGGLWDLCGHLTNTRLIVKALSRDV